MTFAGMLPFERISSKSAGETKKNLGKAIYFDFMKSLRAFSQIVRSSCTFSSPGSTHSYVQ